MLDRSRRLWAWLRAPNARFPLAVLVGGGIVAGAFGLWAFDTTMHATSSTEFCLSCHELQLNIGYEYVTTSHAENARGIFVECKDCHIPKPFVPKMIRKVQALREVYHHLTGMIDTPEKFEEHRFAMASRTWEAMIENDSRECRSCHKADLWDLDAQSEKARDLHRAALRNGKTCISCHKGVAHSLPEGIVPTAPVPEVDDPGHEETASR